MWLRLKDSAKDGDLSCVSTAVMLAPSPDQEIEQVLEGTPSAVAEAEEQVESAPISQEPESQLEGVYKADPASHRLAKAEVEDRFESVN